ncbi:hypothetical protein PENTCL1PPCAC_4624, partial [Pristionchus entomophagus]
MHRKFLSLLPIVPFIGLATFFIGSFNVMHDNALESSTYMSSVEIAVVFIHSCCSITSIPLNLLMTFIAFRHIPASFSTFGIMLKIHALVDLWTALGSSASMLRVIPIDWFVLHISYGPCGYFGATSCFITTSIMFWG